MPPPPMDRRDFLKAAGLIAATPLLDACGESGLARVSPTTPTTPTLPDPVFPAPGQEPASFDFPLVLALPFAHGVASGDPLSDRVIVWTRITEIVPSAPSIAVRWQVSTSPTMSPVLKSGTQSTSAARDWTVKVDVTGLAPATTYYYRFSALGQRSITGRTRTAPASMVDNIRFAVVACSSYWSSTWSGYQHIAEKNDLDLVVHCGDYIYDFIDQDEFVRSRKNSRDLGFVDNRDWLDITELRRRYALYRSDPQLMRAHQQHPWFIVWDNHDIDEGYGNELETPFDGMQSTTTLEQTTQVFWEWTPSRPPLGDGSGRFLLVDDGSYPAPADNKLLYRRLPYGPLAEFFGVDTQIGLPGHGLTLDSSHLPEGTPSLYGRPQFEWFTGGMVAAEQAGVKWKIVNNQTWFAPADTPDVIAGFPSVPKIGISRWSDYAGERTALCEALRGSNPANLRVRGTVLVSGDSHGNFGSDVIETTQLVSAYQPGLPGRSTRNGSTTANAAAGAVRLTSGNVAVLNNRAASVGVEFAPSSLGRGGADELVLRALVDGGAPLNDATITSSIVAAKALETVVLTANKNVQFIDWVDHGYGIVDLTADRAIFEYWWQDKLTVDSLDVLGMQMVSWGADDATALPQPHYRDQLDYVLTHGMTVAATTGTRVSEPAPLTEVVMPR
ncbi:MAG: alkaline phosphatase D family protein [Stagnimonas sp.]|nr:alkaline phosphatase D family protein [Stagnimonas sp.]